MNEQAADTIITDGTATNSTATSSTVANSGAVTDVLVVGGGLAGLTAAVRSEAGPRVRVGMASRSTRAGMLSTTVSVEERWNSSGS